MTDGGTGLAGVIWCGGGLGVLVFGGGAWFFPSPNIRCVNVLVCPGRETGTGECTDASCRGVLESFEFLVPRVLAVVVFARGFLPFLDQGSGISSMGGSSSKSMTPYVLMELMEVR